jgi:hypothetical protein
MSQSSVLDPADRLERLEQETKHLASLLKTANHQISFLQIVLLLISAGMVGGGYYAITTGKLRIEGLSPAVAKTVEAKEFGLYNRFGTRVVFDGDDKFGQPRVTFLDNNKQLQMRLLVYPEGPDAAATAGVALYDKTGWRGVFRMDGDMGSALRLKGEGQKGGIDMTVDRDGTPSLKLTDKAGKVLWEAPTKPN